MLRMRLSRNVPTASFRAGDIDFQLDFDRRSWEAELHGPGRPQLIGAFRVGGLPVGDIYRAGWVDPNVVSTIAADRLPDWSRVRGALGETLWRRLRSIRVLIVGSGRNGALIASQLVASGVRNVVLLDPDVVEPHNLDAPSGLRPKDVGRLKCVSLGAALQRQWSDISVACVPYTLHSQDGRRYVSQSIFDLLITAVDNDTARIAAAMICRERLMPHLDLGTLIRRDETSDDLWERMADVRLLLPTLGCVWCVGGTDPSALPELTAPRGAMARGLPQEFHQERAGSLAPLNSLATGAACNLLLDFLNGQHDHSVWMRLDWSTRDGIGCHTAPVRRDPNCPVCNPRGGCFGVPAALPSRR